MLIAALGVSLGFFSASDSLAAAKWNTEGGALASGYDLVSYIEDQKAVKGKKEFVSEYKGHKVKFSSAKNKELFQKDPEKYIPAYNGWCAYAIAKDNGSFVEINPKAFKVVNGRTHLFYKNFFANTLKRWNKNEANLKKSAEKNWVTLNK